MNYLQSTVVGISGFLLSCSCRNWLNLSPLLSTCTATINSYFIYLKLHQIGVKLALERNGIKVTCTNLISRD